MQTLTPELHVAIADAIDVYHLTVKSMQSDYMISSMVRRIVEHVRPEPGDDEWLPSLGDAAALMMIESLRRSGYELTKIVATPTRPNDQVPNDQVPNDQVPNDQVAEVGAPANLERSAGA